MTSFSKRCHKKTSNFHLLIEKWHWHWTMCIVCYIYSSRVVFFTMLHWPNLEWWTWWLSLLDKKWRMVNVKLKIPIGSCTIQFLEKSLSKTLEICNYLRLRCWRCGHAHAQVVRLYFIGSTISHTIVSPTILGYT